MNKKITEVDVLQAVVNLAVADMRINDSSQIKPAISEACISLIDAGLVSADILPEMWRRCDRSADESN